ncbi:MAG: helicase-related protein, partial [Acinetobacter sp.]|nr:helicase-related protein [Acinetobacter sp.]
GSESHVDYCNILLKSLRPNDNITLTKKARQSDLICEGKIKYGIESIKKGDAVVFFSKAKVENFASQLVEAGYKVSILYGDMPLENRKKQAEAFANGITDILVTTDVIGYGLNLPIERVVFGQISKSNGIEQEHKPLYMPEPRQITGKGGHKPLSIAEVQQIAGRAGRGIKNGSFAWFDFLNGAETYAGISLLDFEKNAKKINSVVMHDEKNFYFKANLQDFANYATKRKRRIYIYAEYFLLNSLALSNVQAKMIAVNPFTRISLKNIKCPELIAFANFNKLPASKNAKLLTPQCELYSPKKGYNGQLLENELGSLYRSVLCKAHDENKLLDFLREIDRFEPSKKDKALRLMLTVFNALGYDTEPLRAKRIQLCEKLNEELIEENILAVFEARREVLKNTLKHKRDYLDTLVNNAGILEKLNKISENGELETLDKLLNTLKLRENVTSLKELEMFSELVALNVVDISHFPLIKQILDDTSNRVENIMMFFKQLGVTWRDWFAITEQWSLDPSVRDFISHFHHFITIFQMLSTSLKAKSDNQCLISTAYNLYFCLPELLAKIRTDSRRIEIDFDLDMVQQMYEQMVLDGESDIEQSKAEVNTKLAELNTEIRKIKRKLKLE